MSELEITEVRSACGCHEDHGEPELDARAIPLAIRHATIFGALSAIKPGGALILVAPAAIAAIRRILRKRDK